MQHHQRNRKPQTFFLLLIFTLLLAACATTPSTNTPVATGEQPATTPESATESTTESATESNAESTTESSASLFPLTITDAAGQEFTFDAPPKIGCFWSGCSEILADLGVVEHASRLAVEEGVESPFFYPVGYPTNQIVDVQNPEDWAAAEVDIIIMRVPDADWLNAIKEAAPMFFLHHPSYGESSQSGYEAYRENLRIVAQLIGKPEAANAAIERFDNTLTNLKQLSTPETAELVTAFLWEDEAYRAVDGTNPVCQILVEVGLGNCIDAVMWDEINPEAFLAIDPDVIVFMNNDSREYTERTDPIWPQLKAVKEGNVFSGIGYYYCCGTRTMIYSLQEYAHFILPDAVPDPGPMADFVVEESPLTQPVATGEAGSTKASADAFPVTIEHKFGSITIESEPQRVIALGYSEQDPILALGVKPIAVRYWFGNHPYAVWPWAQDELGDAAPEVLNMPFGELNYELLTSLKPDLIVATHSGITAEEYAILEQIAPTLAQSGDYVDFGVPWQEQTKIIGRALGREELAIQVVEAVEKKITDAAEAHPEFAGTTFAWASTATDPGTYWITSPEMPPMRFLARLGFGFSPEMTEFIGTASSGLLSSERLDLIDGGILLYQARTPEGLAEFNNSALLQALDVVKGGHTLFFDSTEVPVYGALSFSTVLSLEYAVDELVPMLVDALQGTE